LLHVRSWRLADIPVALIVSCRLLILGGDDEAASFHQSNCWHHAAAWPLTARAQQMRRIGIVIALSEGDPELKKWLGAFREGLEREGRNVHLDHRFAPAGAHAGQFAKELLALQPDVILATPVAAAFQRETRRVPVVFIGIADAITQGFVHSLAHPEGNLTGLTMYEASVSSKYLSMLKEIEPQLTHTGLLG
jgi:putative tryptophan/tyrosine transport system substrate-binding protein